jgi:ribosomal protein L37E
MGFAWKTGKKRRSKMTLVCLKCGSVKLGVPPYGMGIVPGRDENAGFYHCKKCGWTGFPVDVKNAAKFRAHLKKLKSNKRKMK